MTSSIWTEDAITRLRTLWLEGRTADRIARDLGEGFSRSAVLGKVYRLGLSSGREASPSASRPRSGSTRRDAGDGTRVTSRQARAAAQRSELADRGLASILSVRRCQCRWPFGEPRQADFSLCGRPVSRGAFCGSHAALAYRARPDTAKDLERLIGLF